MVYSDRFSSKPSPNTYQKKM